MECTPMKGSNLDSTSATNIMEGCSVNLNKLKESSERMNEIKISSKYQECHIECLAAEFNEGISLKSCNNGAITNSMECTTSYSLSDGDIAGCKQFAGDLNEKCSPDQSYISSHNISKNMNIRTKDSSFPSEISKLNGCFEKNSMEKLSATVSSPGKLSPVVNESSHFFHQAENQDWESGPSHLSQINYGKSLQQSEANQQLGNYDECSAYQNFVSFENWVKQKLIEFGDSDQSSKLLYQLFLFV